MSQTEPLIRNISDTARWAAAYRARENDRPDALFRDPFARRLAGERGEQIDAALPFSNRNTWAWVTRTYLMDQFIAEQLQSGIDMVVNLAAGLDARPYRMALPSSLIWIEVDLPELIAYKEEILGSEKPTCILERVRLDLSNVAARRELFGRLGRKATKALIITEGLIAYLSEEEVGALAEDLAVPQSFQRWVLDLASPALLRMLQRKMGSKLDQAGAPLKFAPPEGPDFFIRHGWRAVDVRPMFETGVRLKRVPFWIRLMGRLPQPKDPTKRVWSGICLLTKV
jgi:methyltransferase (TIGR00027 family)